jgi:putative ABC transport system permease protein
MLKNYFKVAVRYLLRNKEYTIINVLGLAVGIACCILIMLFVRNEFSYNKFHTKADRTFRLWQDEKYQDQKLYSTTTPISAAKVIQAAYPEVEAICRVYSFNPMVRISDNNFTEPIKMVDSTFFRCFDFKLAQGDPKNPFPSSYSIILTPATAKRFFGTANAIGKNIEMQMPNEKALFTVTGIAEEAPVASTIKYGALIPFSNDIKLFSARKIANWFNVCVESYVQLNPGITPASVEKKFPTMIKQYLGERYVEGGFLFHLQPVSDVYFGETLPKGTDSSSNPKYSYILASIGILILLVACINFITLSIGRSTTRAMEVGVRKVLGAERKQLIWQFWSEAFLLTLFAILIGFGLSMAFLKPFNQLAGQELVMQFDGWFLLFALALIMLIALVAGFYPSIILSAFNPIQVLKGKLKLKGSNSWLRQSLVVGQFVASIAMIVCTIMISKQMNYMRTKDLGYSKEQVVVVPTSMPRVAGMPLAKLYRDELIKQSQVKDAAVSTFSFAENFWVEIGFTDDKNAYHSFQYNSVDPNFLPAMNVQVAQGRLFASDNPSDVSTAAVVNEAFIKEFNITDPIGKKLPGPWDQQIIGVVKDFNFESLHNKVRPLIMTIQPDSILVRTENVNYTASPQPRISVRLKPGNLAANIALLQATWKKVAPNQDFTFQFLDEAIQAQYQQEQRTSTIVKIASALSVFIACMGLFGLVTLSVTRRTKEIGIRKVLGANVGNIVRLISKDFLRPVLVATIIAFPIAYWFLDTWLKDFAYRTDISWWVFALAGISALLIALVTISFQAIKAALANPVKSLRTE